VPLLFMQTNAPTKASSQAQNASNYSIDYNYLSVMSTQQEKVRRDREFPVASGACTLPLPSELLLQA
jgi:hypothetical protein